MDKSYKIAGLVFVLLGIMVATTYLTGTTPEALSTKKPSEQEKAEAKNDAHGHGDKKIELPKPIGPKDAKVKVRVYVTSDNSCDTKTLTGMEKLAAKYKDKVRMEFVDLLDPVKAAEAQKAKISCKSGITINGLSAMKIPGYGIKGLVMFDGPIGQKNYGIREVEAGVQQVLEKQGLLGAKGEGAKGQESKG